MPSKQGLSSVYTGTRNLIVTTCGHSKLKLTVALFTLIHDSVFIVA